jgi:hypothetical protein
MEKTSAEEETESASQIMEREFKHGNPEVVSD